MKIYTKTGDKGKTSLFGGKRVSKSNKRVDAYGSVDELNSLLGVALVDIKDSLLKKELLKIQYDLLAIGAQLANPNAEPLKGIDNRLLFLEQYIDRLTKKLPLLQNFILPGGGRSGANLHYIRTVCRRVERLVVALYEADRIDENLLMYFNRLSDVFFTMARYANMLNNKKETNWIQSKSELVK